MPVLRKHIASAPFVGVPGVRHFSGDNALTDEWVKLDKSSFAPLADDDAGGAWATMPDDSRIATVEVINNSPDGGASIYVLFRDASGTLAAYRLADSALASAEDPLFANVRQTISAEMQAIEAAKPMQTRATLNALAKLRASLASLPLKTSPTDAQASTQTERSRLRQILSQFVRISHDDAAAMLSLRDETLSRSLAALDLRAAEAALFVRDQDEFKAALERARSGIEAVFDTDAPARTIRIPLPADVSLSAMRKYKKGVSFMMSDAMRKKVEMLTGKEKSLVQDDPPSLNPEGGGLFAFICSFSIQIIFIVAFFLLIMFVVILDFVFWWMAFFKICFPVPKALLPE